jgi:hypothetical protein
MWLARNEVSRHTGKRNGEIVKALEFGIWKGDPVKDQRDLLTRVEAAGELEAFAETELEGARDFVGILFTAKGKILERCLASQHFIPVDVVYDLPDLRGGSPCGIYAANQSPHASAGDVTDGNSVLFHPL